MWPFFLLARPLSLRLEVSSEKLARGCKCRRLSPFSHKQNAAAQLKLRILGWACQTIHKFLACRLSSTRVKQAGLRVIQIRTTRALQWKHCRSVPRAPATTSLWWSGHPQRALQTPVAMPRQSRPSTRYNKTNKDSADYLTVSVRRVSINLSPPVTLSSVPRINTGEMEQSLG